MDMRMEVDAISEGLDHSHHSWHELPAGDCVQELHKCPHRTETEVIEELSLEAEEQPQHLRNSKDNLAMRNIQKKLFSHPLAPILTALGMARWTESAGLAGKHQETLLPTVGTPDAGKAAHRIAAVEIALDNILDDRPEISILLLETILIF